jgi:hypothetical protein
MSPSTSTSAASFLRGELAEHGNVGEIAAAAQRSTPSVPAVDFPAWDIGRRCGGSDLISDTVLVEIDRFG